MRPTRSTSPTCATIDNPFPPIVPVKPRDDCGVERREPAGDRPRLRERDRVCGAMAPGRRAPAVLVDAVEVEYVGSAGKHLIVLLQPERGAAGRGLAGIAAAHPALVEPLQHAAVRSAQPLDVPQRARSRCTQRFSNGLQFLVSYTYGKALDYGGSAASGGGAVGNGADGHQHGGGHGPSGFDVRHRRRGELRLRAALGKGRRWLSDGGACSGRWSAAGSLAGITTVTTGRPFTVFLQPASTTARRAGRTASGIGRLGQSDRRSVVRPGGFRGASAEHLRRLGPRHPVRARPRELRHVALEALLALRADERRVPVGRVQPVQSPRLRLPEREHRQPHALDASRRPWSTIEACSSR